MKKNNVKILVNVSLAIVCIALFLLLFISILFAFNQNVLAVILSVGLGLFIILVSNSIFHELGHAIIGVFSGLELYSIKFFCFLFVREKGKIKFKFDKSLGELGSTVLNPKTKEKVLKKYVASAMGGLGATFILLLAQILICSLTKNLIVYCALGITFPLTVYIFMVNLLPVFENNDGYLVYKYLSGGDEREIIENYFTLIAELFLGVEPCDVTPSLLIKYNGVSGYSANIRYLRYLAFIRSDEERALKELREISDLSAISNLNDEIFEELFFSAILLNDKRFIKANEQSALAVFEKPVRPQTYRIHGAYRIWSGEKDWAKLILKSGIEFCKDYAVKGLASSEKKYMELLIKNI